MSTVFVELFRAASFSEIVGRSILIDFTSRRLNQSEFFRLQNSKLIHIYFTCKTLLKRILVNRRDESPNFFVPGIK